ncbi:hypothetical protein F4009_18795 [Candidatus Poribacteria bacterium]|nr:hypothetical protein [Candidatus Poribacteria bacterium]MYK96018.1 hypothetical protein [Candidatus Poribacteria bacterium]
MGNACCPPCECVELSGLMWWFGIRVCFGIRKVIPNLIEDPS